MRASLRSPGQGFSLIELMVAVVIAGILAAFAYPAYTNHIQRSRRADAIGVLTTVMQAQERYRSNSANYASTLTELKLDASKITQNYSIDLQGVSLNGNPADFSSGYEATVKILSSGKQANDVACKTLTITMKGASPIYSSTGDPNKTGSDGDSTSVCWPK